VRVCAPCNVGVVGVAKQWNMSLHTLNKMHANAHLQSHTHKHTSPSHKHTRTRTHTHTRSHTHTRTHTHTHTHTRTHKHKQVDRISGQLTDPRSRFLGTRPPRLFPVSVRGHRSMLALSSRPWLGFSDHGRFSINPLSYEALDYASGMCV